MLKSFFSLPKPNHSRLEILRVTEIHIARRRLAAGDGSMTPCGSAPLHSLLPVCYPRTVLYFDHWHFVRGQKHFLVAEHRGAREWRSGLIPRSRSQSNERLTLSFRRLAIERRETASEMNSVWGWLATKKPGNYHSPEK